LVILIIKRVNYIIIFSVFLVALFGCKSKTETPPDVGYDYAPTNIGKYVVYDVDSTVYDDFHHDTTYYKFRIKEQLAEAITDNEGRATIKLIRYIKQYNPLVSYDNIAWTLKDVWSYTKTNTTLEVVEEDIRFTKLIFPATADAIWDGNARNTIGEWDYKYIYVNTAETINGANFDNVLYVEQKDDKNKNAIHRQFYIEKYAKNVGLVYREIKDLYSNVVKLNPNGTIKPVEQRIEKGVIYKLTYVTHGSE
jgi:hypothetical protein